MDKKIVTVVGATGAQGGGLVEAILADLRGAFRVRAITRKPSSDAARRLISAGVEVVVADLDDVASLERAFSGSHGAFCVTNFWEHFSPEKELQQAKNLADATLAADVKHVIWSTLEDTRKDVPLTDERMPTLSSKDGGKYKVPHFDAKGEADQFFDAGRTTFLFASFYWDNLVHFGMGPKANENGELVFSLPLADKRLAGVAASDIGRFAYALLQGGPVTYGKRYGLAGDLLSGAEMAAQMSRVLERKVVYRGPTFSEYRALGFPGSDDLGNMFQYYAEFEAQVNGTRDPSKARALLPDLQTFATWLVVNRARLTG